MASRRRSAAGTISRASTSRGKIMVVLVNDPDFEGGEGDFGGKAMTYYGRWTYKYEEAARQGAAGRAGHPRDRAGQLRLGDGQEFATPTPCSTSSARTRAPSIPRSRAGSSAIWPPRCSPLRAPFRGDEGGRQAPRLQAGRRSRPALDVNGTAKTEVITSKNVVGHPARRGAARRNRHLHRPLGPSRHRPARRERRPDL